MDENTVESRRRFIRRPVEMAAAAAVASIAKPLLALAPETPPLDKNDKKTLAAIFDGIALTDQHGEKLDPAELFRDGEAIILFGYGGCPRCQEISHTVAAVQQKLIDKGKKVPIIVVSVQPENDKDAMREYIARYHELGVRQFQPEGAESKRLPAGEEERRKQAEEGFDRYEAKKGDDKKEEQAGRIFHIVCPPQDGDSKTIQERMSEALKLAGSKKLLITSDNPKQHPAFMTVFSDGNAVETYRALNPDQKAPPAFANGRADEIVSKIMELEKGKRR